MTRQPDLFLAEPDPELWDQRPVQVFRPDPDRIRRRLHALLARMRAAQRMPLPEHELRTWQTVFPNMAQSLPEDEGEQLQLEFAREMQRLAKAA